MVAGGDEHGGHPGRLAIGGVAGELVGEPAGAAPRPCRGWTSPKASPTAHRTAVIVPAMLSSAATVDKLLEHLELRYLGNRSPNLLMVLLTDLPDALQEQMPEDKPLLERALGADPRVERPIRGARPNGILPLAPAPPVEPAASGDGWDTSGNAARSSTSTGWC